MSVQISGLGKWFPKTIRTNDYWPSRFAEEARSSDQRELVEIVPQANCGAEELMVHYMGLEASDPFFGSVERRIAGPLDTSAEAETEAAKQALEEAKLLPKDIDVVTSWAAVPEKIILVGAAQVAHLLGATNAYAFGVDAACASIITQIDHAAGLIESGRAKHVLITQSHLMSRVFRTFHPAAPTVGDGAVAMVLSKSDTPSILRSAIRTDGDFYQAVQWARTSDTPWWKGGGDFHLGSDDKEKAQILVRSTIKFASETLQEMADVNQISISDLKVLATMQPRGWVPKAITEALKCPNLIAPSTFKKYAHLGGCGALVNLMEAREQGQLHKGDYVALYAQGAGFTRGATLISW